MPVWSSSPAYHQYLYVPGGFGPGRALLGLLAPLLFLAFVIGLVRCATYFAAGQRSARPPVVRPPVVRRPIAPATPMLASDAERDATARRISDAMVEGRLGMDEGRERIDAALIARHRHDLARLVADLPPAQLAAASPAPTRHHPILAIAAAAVLGAVLLQAIAGLWALWPVALLGVAAVALASRR
jgi:hypothetical protein